MAGMFYSLKETAERLGKTEDEVKGLAEEGKLREFRDGSNLLFKIQEVNALLADNIDMGEDDLELEEFGETVEPAADLAEEPVGQAEVTALPEEEEALVLDESQEELPAMAEEPVGQADAPPDEEEEALVLEEPQEELPAMAEEPVGQADALPDEEEEALVLEESQDELPPMAEEPAAAEESFEEDIFDLGGEELAEPEAEAELVEEPELVEPSAEADVVQEEEMPDLAPVETADATSELGLAPVSGEGEEEDFLLLDEEEPPAESPDGSEEEISLAPESGILASESDITDMDTALTGEGVNVLGDSDADYGVTDDSMAETASPAGTGTEASLEEIEDDVNLDSFGSGSGLLDLSLQADDTSLGGILDEIYQAEGAEEGAGEGASFDDITAEADHQAGEEDMGVSEPVAVAPVTIVQAYGEAIPDTQSNLLGMLLFLPLIALLYTAIVTVAGMRSVMPSILESIQGLVWYITGGAILLALVVAGISFAAGGEKAPRAARSKKEKKTKVKGEKAKKAKKEKAPKKEKPAKEKKKKGVFAKKKR